MSFKVWLRIGAGAILCLALSTPLAVAQGGWYREHYEHLPPGLAKRDRLPPGLERQLVVRGTLPPGLQKKIVHCPQDLERRLPPPPPECEHVVIGGHIVLLNRRTFLIVDVFHLEIG